MKKILVILFLLISTNVWATPPSRVATYTSGSIISSSDVTSNEDALFNYLQVGVDTYADDTILNADINSSANIQSDKLNLTAIAQNVGITAAGSLDNNGATTLDGSVGITGALTVTGNSTFAGTTIADLGTVTTAAFTAITNLGTVTTADINAGTVDATIGATTPANGTFTNLTANTTLKLGTTNQGDVLYDNGTSIVRLTPGTSGQFLQTQGAAANPQWATDIDSGNLIFSFRGVDDAAQAAGDGGHGMYSAGTTVTPTSSTPTNLFFVRGNNTANNWLTMVQSFKWVKLAGVDTLTVYLRAWVNGGTGKFRIDVNDGALTGDSATTTSTTPADLAGFTVDVSSLTNGDPYDIEIQSQNASENQVQYVSVVMIYGS